MTWVTNYEQSVETFSAASKTESEINQSEFNVRIKCLARRRFWSDITKMDPVVLNIVFLHCVIWWLLYFRKEAAESHITMHNQGLRFGFFFLLGYTDGNVSPFVFSDYCRYTHIYPNGCGDPLKSLYNELQAYFFPADHKFTKYVQSGLKN